MLTVGLLVCMAVRSWAKPEPLVLLTEPGITEASGLAAGRMVEGTWFTHNDSGDSARFFRFREDGTVDGEWSLAGVEAVDWEDMASAAPDEQPLLYLADIGDNARRRGSVKVYRLEEPTDDGGVIEQFETLELTYPDGAQNAEAFFVDPNTGDLMIVAKVDEGPSGVYWLSAPEGSGRFEMEKLGELRIDTGWPGGTLVTGGDASPDGRWVALRTYSGIMEYEVGGEWRDWWRSEGMRVVGPVERQGEAIAYSPDGRRLLTVSEGEPCPVSVLELMGN